jgi:hypothetical protein
MRQAHKLGATFIIDSSSSSTAFAFAAIDVNVDSKAGSK